VAACPPGDTAIPRQPSGPRPWFRQDSPFIWARTTIARRPWYAPTKILQRGGDREAFNREAAALYLEECRRRGVGRGGAPLPRQVVSTLTLKQLVAAFIAHEEDAYTGHDERHVSRYETDLVNYILTRWDRVEQITSDAWDDAAANLHKRKGGPLGSRSIAHLANTLRHFLRYCDEVGALANVPEIKSPPTKDQRAERQKRTALTAQQRDRFLRALLQLGEDRAHRIYVALFFSLLRQNELSALEESWVNWKRHEITIPGEHTKSGEPETIDLHPRVRRVLRAQLHDLGRSHEGPIFGRFDFHQANTAKLKGGLFGRACLKAKLVKEDPKTGKIVFAGLTPHHVTRHSAATQIADQPGTTLVELMAQARWRSPAMAQEYLHPTVEAGRRASRRLR